MKYLYSVLLALLVGVPAWGNVVFNSGFEMGTDGFIINYDTKNIELHSATTRRGRRRGKKTDETKIKVI
jgi:hypothetical protein